MVAIPHESSGRTVPAVAVCDLDGTVVDSTQAMARAVRVGCASVGLHLGSKDDLAWCVGPRIEESLRRLVGSERMLDARDAFRAEYKRSGCVLTTPMPNAVAALSAMRRAGVVLAIATYKPEPMANMVLEALSLRSLFTVVVGRRIEGDERPKGALLRVVLESVDAAPTEAVYIGDHDEDSRAAIEVGVEFLRYGEWDWPGICKALTSISIRPGP